MTAPRPHFSRGHAPLVPIFRAVIYFLRRMLDGLCEKIRTLRKKYGLCEKIGTARSLYMTVRFINRSNITLRFVSAPMARVFPLF